MYYRRLLEFYITGLKSVILLLLYDSLFFKQITNVFITKFIYIYLLIQHSSDDKALIILSDYLFEYCSEIF